MSGQWKTILHILVSAGLLTVAWQVAGGRAILQEFRSFHGIWAAAAILLTAPQILLSAARWRLTAGQLGARLGYGRAVADYALATFVNQVLPTGVLGDALRAWRHGRREIDGGAPGVSRAARAVIYERASGQAVMFAVVLIGAALWPFLVPAAAGVAGDIWLSLLLGLTVLGVFPWMLRAVRPRLFGHLKRYAQELAFAILHRDVVAAQIGFSVLVVGSYLAAFYCAGRAIGVDVPPAFVGLVAPAVLLSMAVPVSVAGWGIRESVAALLWAAAGLTAAQGVAVSVAYGLLILAGSLPGALVLISGR